MTDEELICAFMEEKPVTPSCNALWWYFEGELGPGFGAWHPIPLSLDFLHLVEDRLLSGKPWQSAWLMYQELLAVGDVVCPCVWHASAAEKIKALAQVIRSSQEKP